MRDPATFVLGATTGRFSPTDIVSAMPTKISFRAAQDTDLATIVELIADDELGRLRDDPRLPLASAYRDALKAIKADPNQLLAVALDGEQVIGTLQISFIPGIARMGAWRGQIEAVRVARAHRSSGLGRRMFEWAISQCRSRNCSLVQLTTDKRRPDAHRFYEKLGFVPSHVGYKLSL
jgi:GNAT superfamily N-acetyltransferase